MPRTARVVVPGLPHHITQRGTRRFDVFRDEADRLEYQELFVDSCRQFSLCVAAYCLMTNHVHFVAIPENPDSIHRVFHRVNGTHSKRFNAKYGYVGHLWQERPFSCVLDERHFWNAIRYVEQNPVRAGMVDSPTAYRWSSAAAHCDGRFDPLLEQGAGFMRAIPGWHERIVAASDSQADQFIRDCTFKGHPCGDSTFIKQMEVVTDRVFTPGKRGRKPKP